MNTTTDKELKGLGGWLIIPALGLFIYPIRMAMSFKNDFLPIFQEGYWEILTTPGSEAYHHLWAPLLIFEMTFNSIFIILNFIMIYLFFTKHYRFPGLYIIFLASNLIFVVVDFFIADFIPALANQDDMESLKEVIRTVVSALIWIPYFMVSERVKNTFVNRGQISSSS